MPQGYFLGMRLRRFAVNETGLRRRVLFTQIEISVSDVRQGDSQQARHLRPKLPGE